MQISLSLARKAVFGTAAVAAALMLSACGGGSTNDDNLIYVQVKVESITQEGKCDPVSVSSSPKALTPGPVGLANDKLFYTELDMAQATPEDVACHGEKQSRPMAPGIWEFKVMLPSGPVICERDIQMPAEGQPGLTVSFKDGDTSCT
jgi:hypothetical protein